MKTALGSIVCIVGLIPLLVGCDDKSSVTIPLTTTIGGSGKSFWLVEYYVNSNSLSYAVISGPFPFSGDAHRDVDAGGMSDGRVWVDLRRPDGSEVSILDTGRIFQVTGTNVFECPQRISGRMFQAFLDIHPTDYSISTLLAFAAGAKVATNPAPGIAVEPADTPPSAFDKR